ncbi:hypothetical protein [Dyadobacter sp. 32]|uniref:hypothetical protein n=1 Tax=Dyadobacter sp. 32 TaxID=538966 RepID=UPI0011EBB780
MRKLTSTVLLLLMMQLSSLGQITITLPDSIAGKGWVKNLIREELKKAGPVTTEPVVVDPGLAPCKEGPEIREVSNVTSTSLSALFHGVDITSIRWKITSETDENELRSGVISPTSNTPGITFAPLAPGKYLLRFSGGNCKSAVTLKPFAFTIKSETSIPPVIEGPGVPGVVTPEPSSVTPAWITRGMPWHLNVEFSGNSGNWHISDSGKEKPDDGYEFRYIVNGELLTQTDALKNYKYESNGPIRILKFQTKPGLETLNKWSDSENNYYYSTTAGRPFSHNVTAALYTGVFKGGELGNFSNPIPSGYNTTLKNTQWADIVKFKLPKGHVFHVNKGDAETFQQQFAAGLTHASHYQLPWDNLDSVRLLKKAGLTYNSVPRPEGFLGLNKVGADDWSKGYNKAWWPKGPLDAQAATAKAAVVDLDAVWIGETLEGDSYMPQNEDMWRHFYRQLRKRYEFEYGKKGIPYYICHNYFQLGMPGLNGNPEEEKALFRTPEKNQTLKVFLPGGTLADNNLIVTAVYLSAPDLQLRTLYNVIYEMALVKTLKMEGGIFLAGVHEWKPNNYLQVNYPEGDFYYGQKIPLDPNIIIGAAFLSQVYGKVYVDWGDTGKSSTNKIDYNPPWSDGLWFPNGATSPASNFPYFASSGPRKGAYSGSTDLSAFGVNLFAKTFGIVENGESRYLRFRIDGGAWITPGSQQYADEVVDAFHQKRGFVYSRTREGRTAWFYLNAYADNLAHKLDVVLPDGRTVTETVSSAGVHAKLQ